MKKSEFVCMECHPKFPCTKIIYHEDDAIPESMVMRPSEYNRCLMYKDRQAEFERTEMVEHG